MDDKEHIEDVIVKYIAGFATDAERLTVHSWLHESEANKRLFDEFKDVYEVSGVLKDDDFDTEKSWKKVKAKYDQRISELKGPNYNRNHQPWIKQLIRVAAVFVMAFLLGIICFYYVNQHQLKFLPIAYNEVIAPYGAKTEVILADGTKVWLNAGSKLKYPVDFSKASRDVYLEGEAYFNVVKMTSKKFIVHTSHLNIKVLGTEFNVKAYPEEKTIQTTLIRGLVTIEKLNKNESGTPVYLKPNQQATFVKTASTISLREATKEKVDEKLAEKSVEKIEPIIIVPKVTTEVFTSWKDSRWLIKGEELQTLAVKLERRYDVNISFKDESLKKYKFSGILTDETFEQVLGIMKLIAPIEYSIQGKQVVFTENRRFKKTYDEALINR